MLVIDYYSRISITALLTAVSIDYRLSSVAAKPMELVDTFRIHIGSWQLVVSGYDQQTMPNESIYNAKSTGYLCQ